MSVAFGCLVFVLCLLGFSFCLLYSKFEYNRHSVVFCYLCSMFTELSRRKLIMNFGKSVAFITSTTSVFFILSVFQIHVGLPFVS